MKLIVLALALVAAGAESIISSLEQLPLDENDRLATNALLYPNTNACRAKMSNIYLDYRDKFAISPELAEQYFGKGYNFCATVCLEKGIMPEGFLHPLPQQVNGDGMNIRQWINANCQKVEIGFVSYNENNALTYWIDDNGERRQINTLKYGERNTQWHTSYLGHEFHIVDIKTGELLLNHTVTNNGVVAIGQPPSKVQEREVSRQVKSTFEHEWQRAHKVKRTFTEFGFDKGRLPADIWASMNAYYYNNRENRVREEWDGKGLYVNWWERDVYMIPMPFNLKKYWQSRLKELVEAWTGVEMDLTDIYGMRRYEEGARLLTHTDREETHAASLIINVAQGAVRNPWKVEIYDFADRLHEVEMAPGDIVYYESARCLHGRMRPLDGEYYVNLFAHYRPKGDDRLWYTKPNPPDAPIPMMQPIPVHTFSEVDAFGDQRGGSSTSSSSSTVAVAGGSVVEGGKPIAPFLAPSRAPLAGPQDLYDYWKEVEPRKSASANTARSTGVLYAKADASSIGAGREEL